jgi:hypothetical protein
VEAARLVAEAKEAATRVQATAKEAKADLVQAAANKEATRLVAMARGQKSVSKPAMPVARSAGGSQGGVRLTLQEQKEGWRTDGSEWLGRHGSRLFAGMGVWTGAVVGWQPAGAEKDEVALWRVRYSSDDGSPDDLEDLELAELQEFCADHDQPARKAALQVPPTAAAPTAPAPAAGGSTGS